MGKKRRDSSSSRDDEYKTHGRRLLLLPESDPGRLLFAPIFASDTTDEAQSNCQSKQEEINYTHYLVTPWNFLVKEEDDLPLMRCLAKSI
jgi:hypothetical protein